MQKMHEQQIKRLPKMALWNEKDLAICLVIGLVVGILIGLAI